MFGVLVLFLHSKSFRKKTKQAWNCPDNLIILCYHWSRYVLKFCLLLLFFPAFCYLIENDFYQSVKVWNYWTFIRSMIMISVNYTSSSLISANLKRKKNVDQSNCMCLHCQCNDHDSSACKYFIVVKWVSFFWLAYG